MRQQFPDARSDPRSEFNIPLAKAISDANLAIDSNVTEAKRQLDDKIRETRATVIKETKSGIKKAFVEVRKKLDEADPKLSKAEKELDRHDWQDRYGRFLDPRKLVSVALTIFGIPQLNVAEIAAGAG